MTNKGNATMGRHELFASPTTSLIAEGSSIAPAADHEAGEAMRATLKRKEPLAPDSALLRLAVEFEAAWERERKVAAVLDASDGRDDALCAECDAAYSETKDIVVKIERLKATTLAGLMVKARACLWTHGGEPIGPAFFCTDDCPTTDMRLGASIVRDLINIQAATATGTPIT